MFELDGALKELTAEKRLQERQRTILQLFEEYFVRVKQQLEEDVVAPKSKTAAL